MFTTQRRLRAAGGPRSGLLLAAAVLAVGAASSCGGSSKPDTAARINDVGDAVSRPLQRLSDAILAARPSDPTSMVALRATAGRTSEALAGARRDLRDLEDGAGQSDRARIRDFDNALQDYATLSDELSRTPLSAATLGVAAERVRQAGRESDVALPQIDASALVAAVRRSRRRKALVAGGVSVPVGGGATGGGTPGTGTAISYRNYTGPAFSARIPTGGGWGEPSQSEPTPGRLFRTNLRGPNGLFAIIDFSPFETAKFGGGYSSRTEVGQTAFGSATRYVFTGGRLPECRRSTCIDYIINSGGVSGGSGFAVLAGGGSQAAAIAQTIAESVTPIGQYAD